MPDSVRGDLGSKATYRGFATGEPRAPAAAPAYRLTLPRQEPRRRGPPLAAIALVALGCAVGAGVTLLPDVLDPRPAQPAAETLAPDPALAATAPVAPPDPSAEAAAADLAAEIAPQIAPEAPLIEPPAAPRPPAGLTLAKATPGQREPVKVRHVREPSPAPIAADACGRKASAFATLACRDTRIWDLDRRMNTAFAQAMEKSEAPGSLAADQQDWLLERDRLARDAPGELAAAYGERIRRLYALGE